MTKAEFIKSIEETCVKRNLKQDWTETIKKCASIWYEGNRDNIPNHLLQKLCDELVTFWQLHACRIHS